MDKQRKRERQNYANVLYRSKLKSESLTKALKQQMKKVKWSKRRIKQLKQQNKDEIYNVGKAKKDLNDLSL